MKSKINSFVDVLQPFGILEMVRTGVVAMARGVGVALPASNGNGNGHKSFAFAELKQP